MIQGLAVLPTLRMNRLHEDVRRISGSAERARAIMEAIEYHLERGANRWGNVCALPECGAILSWDTDAGFRCPQHGYLGRTAAVKLLIAFDPITESV